MADTVRDQMATITKQLQTELQSMHEQVISNLQEWQDAAKDQYQVAKQQWDAAAARMPHSLNSAEMTLNNITGGYLKVEHTGQNAWGGYSVK
ncbi:hypothetical protein CFN78_23225 [Amycolatopsis antarctica]|uniref:WXG100 family type VII secretion target n=1 Tax=Amycolatopsis antarctica TaxID=1854586 RepID=A0A263CXF9_9PSEU|nr:WXG100 family type VII secretion target [Amycolatopsis antarctica]OZM70834.1 hypothetical protein CFN78_23225 [Amycolatopsis antarctica]